jgi:hypothetical protein
LSNAIKGFIFRTPTNIVQIQEIFTIKLEILDQARTQTPSKLFPRDPQFFLTPQLNFDYQFSIQKQPPPTPEDKQRTLDSLTLDIDRSFAPKPQNPLYNSAIKTL